MRAGAGREALEKKFDFVPPTRTGLPAMLPPPSFRAVTIVPDYILAAPRWPAMGGEGLFEPNRRPCRCRDRGSDSSAVRQWGWTHKLGLRPALRGKRTDIRCEPLFGAGLKGYSSSVDSVGQFRECLVDLKRAPPEDGNAMRYTTMVMLCIAAGFLPTTFAHGQTTRPAPSGKIAACVKRGVAYFKEIGSYPTLKTKPNRGRSAEEVALERCRRTTTAF